MPIVFSSSRRKGQDWRREALQKFRQQRSKSTEKMGQIPLPKQRNWRLQVMELVASSRVKITSLRQEACVATNTIFDIFRRMRSSAKSQRKVVRKDQLSWCRRLFNCVRITPSDSPRTRGTMWKFWKEQAHREGSFKSVNLMSVILALLRLKRGRKR